jgi:hypothetical protein
MRILIIIALILFPMSSMAYDNGIESCMSNYAQALQTYSKTIDDCDQLSSPDNEGCMQSAKTAWLKQILSDKDCALLYAQLGLLPR